MGIMSGLGKQVIERFKLAWRLQLGNFGAPVGKDQESRQRSDGVQNPRPFRHPCLGGSVTEANKQKSSWTLGGNENNVVSA